MIYKNKEYKAVHNADCVGCAFRNTDDCMKLPEPCMKMYRDDKKGIIWVKIKN